MAALRRTRRAVRDLLDVWWYVAELDPDAADRLVRAIDAKAVLLSENPRLGPERPDLAAGLRYFPVSRYVLLYREIPGGVEIVRCVHGARDLFGLALPEE
jgi:toxin ParE1/3/4